MPEITEEEYKKFQELMKREKQREMGKKVERELYLQKLKEQSERLLDLNRSYGPIQAYAVTFCKTMNKFRKANNSDIFWFNWEEFKRYVTKRCLVMKRGKVRLKQGFRTYCAERGWRFRISFDYNSIRVEKCEPKKTIK